MNRFILLLIPFLSMLLPFVHLQQVNKLSATYILPVFEVSSQEALLNTLNISSYSTNTVLISIYLAGLVVSILVLLKRASQLHRFIKSRDFKGNNGLKVSVSNSPYSTFSFFHFIFINDREIEDNTSIMEHEEWHYKLIHSVDNIFFECLKCIFWFHPFIYAFHKELRNVHEFEIDQLSTLNGNKISYLDKLTDEVILLKEIKLTNTNKSNSNLVKRVKMMYKKPSSSFNKLSYLGILPISLLILIVVSCSESSEGVMQIQSDNVVVEMDTVYTGQESDGLTSMPEFIGGIQAMYEYLGSELKYPETAKEEGLAGKVFVSFVIDNSGKVTNVKLIKGLHPVFDSEALRVISNMPRWIPAIKEGENVAVEYMLPIQFTLQ